MFTPFSLFANPDIVIDSPGFANSASIDNVVLSCFEIWNVWLFPFAPLGYSAMKWQLPVISSMYAVVNGNSNDTCPFLFDVGVMNIDLLSQIKVIVKNPSSIGSIVMLLFMVSPML